MRLKDILKNQHAVDGVRIVVRQPPCWDSVCATVGVRPVNAVFTYGDTIFNPSGRHVSPDVIAHEKVHMEQHRAEGGPELWWGKWLRDPAFRFDQEARGYAAQYAHLCRVEADEKKQSEILNKIASILSGPIYGKCSSHVEAALLVRQYAEI